MPRAPSATLIFLILTSAAALHSRLDPCLGEFTRCPDSGVCTMSSHWCGAKSGCKRGQYLCPSDSRTCVDSAADYAKCPGIKGTHLDWTLGTEARLDFLVAHTSLSAQIGQLHNTAPELLELGVPEYQWLNDDQHGVARTVFLRARPSSRMASASARLSRTPLCGPSAPSWVARRAGCTTASLRQTRAGAR